MRENNKSSVHNLIDPVTLLIVIIASIFSSGALVHLILSIFPPLSMEHFALLDAAILTVVLFPVMYFFVFKPFRAYIEDLKRSEEALLVSEARYRSLVESTDDSVYLVNSKCEYLFMNAKHRSRLGFFGEEYMGRAYGEFHSPEETRVFREDVERVFETGEPLQHEHRSQRDGNYFLRTLSPIRGPHREIVGVSVISKNVTQLKA
ncbi:MAG TPA: PAS domain-containing protein [Thermodesulfovibrionales bacterium]|nr:PAS domain-containing protein [Thermodesulfovibrionales bacterium]